MTKILDGFQYQDPDEIFIVSIILLIWWNTSAPLICIFSTIHHIKDDAYNKYIIVFSTSSNQFNEEFYAN